MNDIDDLDLKAQIDEISKKIDTIVQTIEEMAPKQNDNNAQTDEPDQDQEQE